MSEKNIKKTVGKLLNMLETKLSEKDMESFDNVRKRINKKDKNKISKE